MKTYDANTSERLLVSSDILMERAGLEATSIIVKDLEKAEKKPRILILCGYGNNGGDGLVVGRMLFQKGFEADIFLVGNKDKATALNKKQREILDAYGIQYKEFEENELDKIDVLLYEIVIDSILGIGINRDISDNYKLFFERINEASNKCFALDIPSGINAEGKICGLAIKADVTITFGFTKVGQLVFPAADYCGNVLCVDIGIDKNSFFGTSPSFVQAESLDDFHLPERRRGANKGTYKKLLIIAGNSSVYGALFLAAKSAMASGIGMISILSHVNNREALFNSLPECMYSFYNDDSTKQDITVMWDKMEAWADGILIGPGIGLDETSRLLVDLAVNRSNKPVCFDADAIRIIADTTRFQKIIASSIERKIVFTPHIAEFSALSGCSISEIKEKQTVLPKIIADRLNSVIICKDARTIISSSLEKISYINCTGNDGMATAGSGDVLAGICSVLMLQMDNSFEASAAAVYIHGLSGDLAAAKKGQRSMTARDIIDELNEAWI